MRIPRKTIFLLFAVWLAIIPGPTHAQLVSVKCETFFSTDLRGAPQGIADFFTALARKTTNGGRRSAEIGLRHCVLGGTIPAYIVLFPALEEFGTCYFEMQNITKAFSKDGTFDGNKPVGSMPPPSFGMLTNDSPCPRQDNAAYITTSDVPPGVFRNIMTFWAKATASEDALRSAISFAENDTFSEHAYESLRKAVKERSNNALTVREISKSMLGSPAYEIRTDIGGGGLMIDVDLSEQGWKIIRISSWVA